MRMPSSRWKSLEHRFEKLLWKLRLMAILPVVMSLTSGAVTFVLGTLEILRVLGTLRTHQSGGEK